MSCCGERMQNEKCLLGIGKYGDWNKNWSGCHWCGIIEQCKKDNPIKEVKDETR